MHLSLLNESGTVEVPFGVGGKSYILRFCARPTHSIFRHSPYSSGTIYEIVWFPANRASDPANEKYLRTANTPLSAVREIVRKLPVMVRKFIQEMQPVGFYWSGDDDKLQQLWDRLSAQADFGDYVSSRRRPGIMVKSSLRGILDTVERGTGRADGGNGHPSTSDLHRSELTGKEQTFQPFESRIKNAFRQ